MIFAHFLKSTHVPSIRPHSKSIYAKNNPLFDKEYPMHHKKLTFYTVLGSSLEFFDFTIYAFFAPYISQTFFTAHHASTALLETFLLFAIGYLARPLGSLLFGHLGDRYGRKNTFILTIYIMSVSTLCIGLLPGYASIGFVAPLLLLLLRLIQGLSLGGEVAGSAIFLAEHTPLHKRGSCVAFIFAGVTFGNVFGSLFGLALTHYCTEAQMLLWGWRIPFIFGGVLGYISYKVRKEVQESPVFIAILIKKHKNTLPIKTLLCHHWPQLLQGIGITSSAAVIIFTLLYLPTYYTMLKLPITNGYLYSTYSFSFIVISCIIFGYLSDFFGRRSLLIVGSALLIICGYPLFQCIVLWKGQAIWPFTLGFAAIGGAILGSYGGMLIELFPTHIRYSGMSMAYNVGFALFGGLAPLVNSYLHIRMGASFSPYYLLAIAGWLTLITSFLAPDRYRQSLHF